MNYRQLFLPCTILLFYSTISTENTFWNSLAQEMASIEQSLTQDIETLNEWDQRIRKITETFDDRENQRKQVFKNLKKEFDLLAKKFKSLSIEQAEQAIKATKKIETLEDKLISLKKISTAELNELKKQLVQTEKHYKETKDALNALQEVNEDSALIFTKNVNELRNKYKEMTEKRSQLFESTENLIERIRMYRLLDEKELKELAKELYTPQKP